MNITSKLINPLLLLLLISACTHQADSPFKVAEVSPWCIIGFDSLDRTPKERIDMLKEMGFSKYGFNKGSGDLSTMIDEFKLAKENNIEINSIFLWLNAKRDSVDKLSPQNQELLNNLKKVSYKPSIWLSFSDNFFKELSHEESITQAIEMINFIQKKANELGCELALYNHHGWFGNPYNQIEILEKLDQDALTMVYNFHHAQEYVDEFSDIAKKIKPYLSYVNLNGVKKDGPQILSIGKGDHEFEMIKLLMAEDYNGPWGILGHIKTDDVEKVLDRNIEGLNKLNSLYLAGGIK